MSDKVSYVTKRTIRLLLSDLTISAILISLVLTGSLFMTSQESFAESTRVPTRLVLGLDGIAFSTFRKFQAGGHFRNFNPVSPMVASFPSISDPNWTKLLRLPPEKSFTKAYFDPSIKTATGWGENVGSMVTHVVKQPNYEKVMDFRLQGMWEHLSMLIWTETTAHYWVESLEKSFFKFRGKETYFALIVNTDIMSHTEGEKAIFKYLVLIEEKLDEIQNRYRKIYHAKLEVVLVSDHGNAFFSPEDIPIENLKKSGWKFNSTISGPRDIATYVPEILGVGSFYCDLKSRRDLAIALSGITHLQSSMYADDEKKIHVISKAGSNESVISFNSVKNLISYKVIKGLDPLLGQIRYFNKGALSEEEYLRRSLEDTLPDSVIRIWEGFNSLSEIKPMVLANGELGYVFGNKTLRLVTDLRGFSSSHGGLYRDETFGIFVSTKRELPAIRPQNFGDFIGLTSLKSKL